MPEFRPLIKSGKSPVCWAARELILSDPELFVNIQNPMSAIPNVQSSSFVFYMFTSRLIEATGRFEKFFSPEYRAFPRGKMK